MKLERVHLSFWVNIFPVCFIKKEHTFFFNFYIKNSHGYVFYLVQFGAILSRAIYMWLTNIVPTHSVWLFTNSNLFTAVKLSTVNAKEARWQHKASTDLPEQHSQNPLATEKTTLNKQPSVPHGVQVSVHGQQRLRLSPLTKPRSMECSLEQRRPRSCSLNPHSHGHSERSKKKIKKIPGTFFNRCKVLGEPESSFIGQVDCLYRPFLLSHVCCVVLLKQLTLVRI